MTPNKVKNNCQVVHQVLHKTSISFSDDHCGCLLKYITDELGIKTCKHFISLNDPIPGGQYIGICGLFVKYLKAEGGYGMPIKRCYACIKKYKFQR